MSNRFGTAVFLGLSALLLACSQRRPETTSSTGEERCATCHGDPNRPGNFLERAAPPRDLSAANDPSHPGVGAHQIHLQASSTHAAIACGECHVVPDRVDSPGHADHGLPATLIFGALARNNGSAPRYDTATRSCSDGYCHGDAHAVWNAPRSSSAACGSCHGLPPALPHPQSDRCSQCHGDVVDEHNQFIAPALHVNGHVESNTEGRCTACHGGGDDPAPPRDTLGNSSISAIGASLDARCVARSATTYRTSPKISGTSKGSRLAFDCVAWPPATSANRAGSEAREPAPIVGAMARPRIARTALQSGPMPAH